MSPMPEGGEPLFLLIITLFRNLGYQIPFFFVYGTTGEIYGSNMHVD